jgi:hypothetical protein
MGLAVPCVLVAGLAGAIALGVVIGLLEQLECQLAGFYVPAVYALLAAQMPSTR